MPGLVPGIHVLCAADKAWMAGTSPAMTMWWLRCLPPPREDKKSRHCFFCGGLRGGRGAAAGMGVPAILLAASLTSSSERRMSST